MKILYKYGMRLRGFSPAAQPRGVVERMDDESGKYYDIILYSRKLSREEVKMYDLDFIEVVVKGDEQE